MTRDLTLRLVPVKNIRAHPVRAAIILVLALAQAACVFVGLVALDGMRAQLSLAERRLGADLVVYPTTCLNQVDKRQLSMLGTPAQCDQPRAALSRMDANEDISAVTVQLAIADTQPDGTPLWIVGYDPATDFVISPWIAEGEGTAPPAGTVAVGAAVRQDPVGQVTLFGKQWPVGAHLEATGTDTDTIIFVTMDTLRQVIAASTESGVDAYVSLNPDQDYTVALVRVTNPSDVGAVTEWINLYVRKVSAVRSDLTVATTASDIRAHRAVVLGVLGAAWLVLLAALMLAQLTPMNERRHEIYVWRSIGASRRVIARVLTAESLLVHVVGALAGSQIGVWLLRCLPAPSLPWILIGFTLFVIVSQYLQVPTREGTVLLTPASCALLILVGVCAGILSGLVGVGGGSVIVPGMELAVGAGDLIARGTSLLVMIPTGIAGTVTNLRHRMVDLRVGLIVGASAAATAPAGRLVATPVSPSVGAILFNILLLSIIASPIPKMRRARAQG